jgi:hypothetical protein
MILHGIMINTFSVVNVKMKNKKYYTVKTVPKSTYKIAETGTYQYL